MSLYSFIVEETNGDFTYIFRHLVYADSIKQAELCGMKFVSTFYGEADECDNGTYFFYGGEVTVIFHSLKKTTKKDWCENEFMSQLVS